MRIRAIKDLPQLIDPDFFAAIAEGISLVVKNVARLQAEAAALGESQQMHPRACCPRLPRRKSREC
jgi:hypothetical protein